MTLHSSKWLIRAAFVVVFVSVVLRVFLLSVTKINPDEFQHLHAAYLVAEGATPYVDFFEHHTPLFYYLVAPVLTWFEHGFDQILRVRLLALAFAFVSAGLLVFWAKTMRGTLGALITVFVISANFFLFCFGSVVFLDVFAAPWLIAAAFSLSQSRGRPAVAALAGFMFGISGLITQKVIMAGMAFVVWFTAPLLRSPEDRREALRELGGFLLGGAAAAIPLLILLGPHAIWSFIEQTIIINLAWKAEHFPSNELFRIAATDTAVVLASTIGVLRSAARIAGRQWQIIGEDLPYLFLVSLVVGLFLLPVAWSEYLVLIMHFTVLITAMEIYAALDYFAPRIGSRFSIAADMNVRTRNTAIVALAASVLVFYLPGLLLMKKLWSLGELALMLSATVALAASAYFAAQKPHALATSAFVAALLAGPLISQAVWIDDRTNEHQRERMDFVMQTTGETESVFDGYSGFGTFRPHAFYYWFLHDEVRVMFEPESLASDIIASFEEQMPPIAIVDSWTKKLPEPVLKYIDENYEVAEYEDIFVRRDHSPS